MKNATILVVDDNARLREIVCENLEAEGYATCAAGTGGEALEILQALRVDTVVLDLMLPDADGLGLIPRIREKTDAPVIVVSGKGAWVDKVVGLEMGADDYLGKPFAIRELSARVKANLRRVRREGERAARASGRVKFDVWTLDPARLQIFDENGKPAGLTVMEFHLLETLVRSPGCVLSREQLLERARTDGMDVFDRAIDIQITRIRKKIGDAPRGSRVIRTVRGGGYMLACKTENL
jgi:DNA-binding response OmpR family regulator